MSNRQNQTPESTPEENPKCRSWCGGNIQEWSTKCEWESCEDCIECVTSDPSIDSAASPNGEMAATIEAGGKATINSSTTENFSEMMDDKFNIVRTELKNASEELSAGITNLKEDISLIKQKNPKNYCGEGTRWIKEHKLCKRDSKEIHVSMIGNTGYCNVYDRDDVHCKYDSRSSSFKLVKTMEPGIYGIKHKDHWCSVGNDLKLTCSSNKKLNELNSNEKFEIDSSFGFGVQHSYFKSLKNEMYCEAGRDAFICNASDKTNKGRIKIENLESKDFFQNF